MRPDPALGRDRTWDCHAHVFGDPRRYPLAETRNYTPAEAGLPALAAHLDAIDAGRVVLVQPTVYGSDHGCLLDAMDVLDDRAVGVAAHSEAPPPEHPRLRGLRLDLRGSWPSKRRLRHAADRALARGWHLELQVSPGSLRPLADALGEIPVPVILDHLAGIAGSPPTARAELDALLRRDGVYVKLSGADRMAGGIATALPVVSHLAASAPGRLLWGSDWPHTPLHPPPELRTEPLPFRSVDDSATLHAIGAAIGPAALTSARRDTPEALYGRRRIK